MGQRVADPDPDHVTTAARLREAFSKPRPVTGTGHQAEVVLRDLSVYDAAFGVDLDASVEEAS
jgi:hypothetical protein